MQTLKDIKDVLKDIPDRDLEGLYFGLGEGCEENISLVAVETGALSKEQIGFPEIFEAYPKLDEINNLIKNIIKAQSILDEQDDRSEGLAEGLLEDGITDNYFDNENE